MIVKAKYSDCKHLEKEDFNRIGLFPKSILHLTKERAYEVYAISLFENAFFVLVVNDAETPCWLPIDVFSFSNNRMPSSWVCNFFDAEPKMVIGPTFIAKSIEDYNAMVLLESWKEKLFWEMVKG